ncbi:MAG TPA: hypothetical protein PLJ12_12340, partial [Planctomycetota bacterium]|nr:hypothetical protein [Planctomycetota bacterium]
MKARSSAPLPRPEWWVLLLLTLVVAVVVGHLWVFHGPNRELALWLYKSGRFQAVIAAGVLGLAGIVTGLLRPPLVNPWRLVGLASVLFVVFSAPVPYAYPSSHRDHPSEVTLAMPVAGSWRVLSGGRTSHNALSLEPDRCHGLLLAREEHGTRWRTEQPEHVEPAESWTFGSELFAPAPGLVVAVQDGEPDRSFELRVEEASSRGNHIVLQLSDGA